MFNCYILPLPCPPRIFSSLRPCQAWIPISHKTRCPCVHLYHKGARSASLKAEITLASHGRPDGISPTQPPTLLLPQHSKGTPSQSALQSDAKVQLVESVRQWQASLKGNSRIQSQRWAQRLHRIRKPARRLRERRNPVRTQHITLGPWPEGSEWGSEQLRTRSPEAIDLDWISRIPALKIPDELKTWTSLDTDRMIRYYGGPRSDHISANEKNLRLRDHDSDWLWPRLMLWCLKYEKRQAMLLLLATLKGREYRPPRYVVSESLQFLARHFLFKNPNPDPRAVDVIWLLTRKYIEGASEQEQQFTVNQHLVYCLLQSIDDSRALSFFQLLGQNKAVLDTNTMRHFFIRFLHMGKLNLSMKLIDTMLKIHCDLTAPQIQLACVMLLRTRFDPQFEYTIRSNLLRQFLEMGVRPNLQMFNTILLNAGEGGDFANAWQIYGQAKKNGLVPVSYTYNVLLKGALLSGDTSNIHMVIREIQTDRGLLPSVWLLSNILKAIRVTSREDAFDAMLDFYKQHCHLRPLQELSLLEHRTEVSPGADYYDNKVQPNYHILTSMVLAYIQRHQGFPGLIHIYDLYYQHVKENHPLIASLASNAAIANGFILAFGKNPSTLPHCTTVVKHMLELSSQSRATSDNVAYAAPNVHTWSILVAAYLFNRQSRAAEKVLEMMRERGIEYNQVTWNTLISGYSALQDVNAAVEAVTGMEAAGFEANDYTKSGLGNLWMKDLLVDALKKSPKEPPTDDKGPGEGVLPSLDSHDQHEASKALEWDAWDEWDLKHSLDPEAEKKTYSDARIEKELSIQPGSSSESQVAVV